VIDFHWSRVGGFTAVCMAHVGGPSVPRSMMSLTRSPRLIARALTASNSPRFATLSEKRSKPWKAQSPR
jgi:hypothetical protein